MVENPHCPFCTNDDQTVRHLFVSCPCTTMVDKIPWDTCVIALTSDVFKTEF